MAKYSYELKKEIVMAYLSGEGSYAFLAGKYSIPDTKSIREWVSAYKASGEKGLLYSREQKKYSFKYKMHVVELYLTSEISYRELASQEGINNPSMFARWVNTYRDAGPEGLRPKKRGPDSIMDTKHNFKRSLPDTDTVSDLSVEHVKELEEELLKLRIENAYLKELRRLRLEEESLLKKQRESSTVSEENSN